MEIATLLNAATPLLFAVGAGIGVWIAERLPTRKLPIASEPLARRVWYRAMLMEAIRNTETKHAKQ